MAKVLSQITGGKTGYLKVNNSGRVFGTDKLKRTMKEHVYAVPSVGKLRWEDSEYEPGLQRETLAQKQTNKRFM